MTQQRVTRRARRATLARPRRPWIAADVRTIEDLAVIATLAGPGLWRWLWSTGEVVELYRFARSIGVSTTRLTSRIAYVGTWDER